MPFADIIPVWQEVGSADLKGKAAVIIDVLRATSTITTALNNGCRKVYAVSDIEDAWKIKNDLGNEVVLGGERQGFKIEGFDLGNSPQLYTEEKIKGKTLVLATTNGTRAVNSGTEADYILIACFLNMRAVINTLKNYEKDVVIICAGTEGRESEEDSLCAGGIAAGLSGYRKTGNAERCIKLYQDAKEDIYSFLKDTYHFKYLSSVGFSEDVAYCLKNTDIFSIVPFYDKKGKIIIKDTSVF